MFLTQTPSKFRKKVESNHYIKKSSSFIYQQKSFSTKFLRPIPQRDNSQKRLKENRRTLSYNRKFTTLTSKFSNHSFVNPPQVKQKWHKIVDLYKGPQLSAQALKEKKRTEIINPGIQFYQILGNENVLSKHKLKLNFPETIIMDSYGQMKMIYTNEKTGFVEVKKIQKNDYFKVLKETTQSHIHFLKANQIKYKKYYDFQENPYAPFIVTKSAEDDEIMFQVDAETYKNFQQKKIKPTQNKFVQRYVYSRNMKAMVFRFCYDRKKPNEQRQEYFGYRFQNIDNIFRPNQKHPEILESNKLTSVIFVTYERQNKMEYTKITNKNGLRKFVNPSFSLIKFLQSVHHVKINKISIDYIVDLFDKPWVINIKMIQLQKIDIKDSQHFHKVDNIVSCKVCSDTYEKNQLKKYASNKMVAEFLSHLKKRIKIQNYDQINFLKNINKINTKEHITFHVCEVCYLLISEQFLLIECQKKLASICNIKVKTQQLNHQIGTIPSSPRGLKQWRLMIFISDIVNIPSDFLKTQILNIKYQLGSKGEIEENWPIKIEHGHQGNKKSKISSYVINKIKVHYFFSENNDIDKFLKETQIFLTLSNTTNYVHRSISPDINHENQANGSTGILSHFRNRLFQSDLCLRQTSALLLFFGDGKYCQATIKVGLVCDGVYSLPQNTKLKKINNVYFAEDGYINSNPIPRQWMQAFGINEEITVPQLTYEDILWRRKNAYYERENEMEKDKNNGELKKNYRNSKIERKSICYL